MPYFQAFTEYSIKVSFELINVPLDLASSNQYGVYYTYTTHRK